MLSASGLAFSYGGRKRKEVFTSLDWKVTPGQRTLLLGPNGAGKSTLLKLLCGYLTPQRGSVTFDGSASRRALHTNVAWMPQSIAPIRGLSVVEQLEYAAWVAGMSRKDAGPQAAEAVSAVKLGEQARQRATELSGGQMRRLGLAQALVREGDVLLLDEPTAGLDPAQTQNFRRLLHEVNAPGGIVVATHQVSDLADDVDRVAVLADGLIQFDGTVSEFAKFGEQFGIRSGSFAEIFSSIVQGGLH